MSAIRSPFWVAGWLAVPRRRQAPTPNKTPGLKTGCFTIPYHFIIYFFGGLDYLGDPEAWEQMGDMTPEECAEEWKNMVENAGSRVGEIVMTLGDIPSYGLELDGSSYSGADYPTLFDALPAQYKTGQSFTLPDMRGSFPMGATLATGDAGGAASHTLTVDEMPAHTHATHAHAVGPGGEVPGIVSGVEAPGVSGSAGLGLPHNNLPPYITVRFFVVAL